MDTDHTGQCALGAKSTGLYPIGTLFYLTTVTSCLLLV